MPFCAELKKKEKRSQPVAATLAKCVTELFSFTEGTICHCTAVGIEIKEGYL